MNPVYESSGCMNGFYSELEVYAKRGDGDTLKIKLAFNTLPYEFATMRAERRLAQERCHKLVTIDLYGGEEEETKQ